MSGDLQIIFPDGTKGTTLKRREGELHNNRPIYDYETSIHHSLCWTPFDKAPEWGF